MQGLIVKHTYRGIGKIKEAKENYIAVEFLESGDQATFEKTAFQDKELKRLTLPKRSICSSDGRECVVDDVAESGHGPKKYHVTFHDDGLRSEVSEVELTPTGLFAQQNPFEKLQNQDQGSYSLFSPRENLRAAIYQQLKNGNGLRALLASRIDLRPHQAFVAGVVLLDESRRYLLADEVGLGKTIEAGIVIHDLLINKPDEKILILCPGALTQQWLCELYSKFSGQIFRMLEMLSPAGESWQEINRVIASFADGGLKHSEHLLAKDWDMVVIDEVHHLLSSEKLYDFAYQLSSSTPSVLLLSAIPAKRREDEYLRLLALLEPDRYTTEVIADKDSFRKLFRDQRAIGRKLRLTRRRLEGLENDSFTREETLEQVQELAEFAVLETDTQVQDLKNLIVDSDDEELPRLVEELIQLVGGKYRINRRILRNRRQRLIEDDQITEVNRLLTKASYQSEQLEHEVNSSISDLLSEAIDSEADQELVEVFASLLWQSTVHPDSVTDLLELLEDSNAGSVNETGREFLRLGYLGGNASWESYVELLCRAVRPLVSPELIENAVSAARNWRRDSASYSRFSKLESILTTHKRRRPKILVFAGYPQVAELLTDRLRSKFGDSSTTEFRSELEREEKESNVRKFRTDPATWILVSDESGGEGRNFQFADLLIHYDTPWAISRIEQRIGRLDRLGRENAEVMSLVLFDESSVESGLVQCCEQGLGVYGHSISGLEFAIRDVESKLIQEAICSGKDGLFGLVGEIQELVEEERARDESEALLDEASFDRQAAERFLRVRSTKQSELQLESAFVSFFKMVATGVKTIPDPEFPEGLWAFRGDQIHQIRNAFTNQLANKTFQGTFRRGIAQKRVDLDFFGLGNRLFEAIYHSIHVESLGRTYAIEISNYQSSAWLGFEFIFCPSPNLEIIGENLGLQNRARQYFNFRPIHVFCSQDGEIASNSDELLELRQSMTHEDKNKRWRNFTGQKAAQLGGLFQKESWDEKIQRLFNISKEHAFSENKESVDSIVADGLRVLDVQIQSVESIENGNRDYVVPLQNLRKAIEHWSMNLDSLGFLSVNAGVHERLENG